MIIPTASEQCASGARDLLRRPLAFALFYGLPVVAILLAGNLSTDARVLGVVWAAAFGVMAGACLANARRCRRTHCFFTGPWFLLAAVASLLHGFGVLPAGWLSWGLIGNGAFVGAVLLWCGSEGILGRYRDGTPEEGL